MTLQNSSSEKLKVVALLPMKANSSRVKGKNFRDLAGKPLFRWILDTLLSIDLIDQIVINTDAQDLLEQNHLPVDKRIAIRKRKEEICGDDVSMNLVLQDDINNVNSKIYLMTHTTNPFLKKETLVKAIQMFADAKEKKGIDSLFSVNKHQTRFYRKDCSPINHDPNNLIPTQNLEPWFEENSNLYLFTKDSFVATGARIGLHPMIFETNKIESIDIDTPEDWDLASLVASEILIRDKRISIAGGRF